MPEALRLRIAADRLRAVRAYSTAKIKAKIAERLRCRGTVVRFMCVWVGVLESAGT